MATLGRNYAHLQEHDEQLVRLGLLAERYFPDDPNTSILKLRQLTELLAQQVASRIGLYTSADEAQYDLIRACVVSSGDKRLLGLMLSA